MSIILLECEMSALVGQFEHSLALRFFGIGMKIDLSILRVLAALLQGWNENQIYIYYKSKYHKDTIYVKHYSRAWRYSNEQNRIPTLVGLTF